MVVILVYYLYYLGELTIEFGLELIKTFPLLHILGIDIDSNLIDIANTKIPNELKDKIEFKCCDVMNDNEIIISYLKTNNILQFSLITCFSTTMWIHFHGGDESLKLFLIKISELCKKLIIEPQLRKVFLKLIYRVIEVQKKDGKD